MFTGLISDLGRVRSLEPGDGGTRMTIATGWDATALAEGASVACSGICLTAVARGADWFAVDVSNETRACTTLGHWGEGTPVNLECSLRAGDELGGHFVFGHVDGVARITHAETDGESWRYTIAPPSDLLGMIAPKGSIALDGVSLTVNDVDAASFGVNIIPHTAHVTTFGARAVGDRVNLEVDMLARYVARLAEWQWRTRPGSTSTA